MENASNEDLMKSIERPEDVDKLDLEEAFSWLEGKEIPFEHLETLEEMQTLIKYHLENHGSSKDVPKTNEATSNDTTTSELLMGEILTKDKIMKEELSDVYLELMKFVNEVGEDQRSVMEQLYGDLNEKLVACQEELINNECPIVVAGETSAGKSSLLNLLLGTDVLPHSLLCATSTICRLHNSENKKFEIITRENEIITIEVDNNDTNAEETLKEKLKPFVSSTESRQEHMYKTVEIYWPIPMLQDRVTIVDTPGVGESDQISDRLFEYLPNAVAFIYVINSANAGGIQEDRLLHILEKQEQWRLEGRLTAFDFTSTIFVCNKWDIVEKRQEEEKVWKDTGSKLQNALPGFPLNQVLRMSVGEADRYMKTGLGTTEKFKCLLDSIKRLVPATLKAKTSRHFKFLDMFLQQLQSKIQSRLSNAKKSEEEKKKLHDDVVGRLENLKTCSDRVKRKLLDTAEKECGLITGKLLEYLQRDDVKSRLISWREEDAPDINAEDFEVTKFNGENIIKSKVKNMLKKWEEENSFVKEASDKLTKAFKEECQIISEDCVNVNVVIDGMLENDEDLSKALGIKSPGKQNEALFTKSEKVVLAVAAPLWVPLVTAASLLFLPVGAGMLIKETIRAKKERKDYMENKAKYMRQWTEKVLETVFTEGNIKKFINEVYFGNFERKILELCDDFIPKQIAADKEQVDIIANDGRTSYEIQLEFQPLLYDLKKIMGKLRFYELKYMATDLMNESDLRIEKVVGKGNFSDVYLAIRAFGDKEEKVAMKVLRRKLNCTDMVSQLEEVECLKKFNHTNIVKIYGVCFTTCDEDKETENNENGKRLTMVLEFCSSNLEDHVFRNEKLQCRVYRTIPERKEAFRFYIEMSVGICDGLTEMHQRGYLHRDLKLSNVLVKDNTAKLCDLGFAKMEVDMTGTFVGTFTHMSPELLKQEKYTFSSDIYSLAILLWELWYGHHAYTESEYAYRKTFEILNDIKNGLRPKLEWKHGPTDELKKTIRACWCEEPSNRSSAAEVGGDLRSMLHE